MRQLLAYHNDPAIKALYLARVRAHRAADQIVHGYYWEHGKGCAVGCTLHGNNHAAYEEELGIPQVLAHLEDGIFESLKAPYDVMWPEQFLDAIPVGADLSLVWPQFAVSLLEDRAYGVLHDVQEARFVTHRTAIEEVLHYYKAWVDMGTKPDDFDAVDVTYAAYGAVVDAPAHAAAAVAHAAAIAASDVPDLVAAHAAGNLAHAHVVAVYALHGAHAAEAAARAAHAVAVHASNAMRVAEAADHAAHGVAAHAADPAHVVAAHQQHGARSPAAARYAVALAAYSAASESKIQEVRRWQAQTLLHLLRDAPVVAAHELCAEDEL